MAQTVSEAVAAVLPASPYVGPSPFDDLGTGLTPPSAGPAASLWDDSMEVLAPPAVEGEETRNGSAAGWSDADGDDDDSDGTRGAPPAPRPRHSKGLHDHVRAELDTMRTALEASLRAALENEYAGKLALAETRAHNAELEYARQLAEAEEAFESQVARELDRVRADAAAELADARAHLESDMHKQVQAQVMALQEQANAKCAAVASEAHAQAQAAYTAQLDAVRNEVRQELRSDVERKMRAALLAKMKTAIAAELREELAPTIRRELRAELAVELEREIRAEFAEREQAVLAERHRSALEAEFRDRLDAAVAKEVSDAKSHLEAQAELKVKLQVEEQLQVEKSKLVSHFKAHQVREARESVAKERATIKTAHAELARLKSSFNAYRRKKTRELESRESKVRELERTIANQRATLEQRIRDARTEWAWKEKHLRERTKALDAREIRSLSNSSPNQRLQARQGLSATDASTSILDESFDPKAVASMLILRARAQYRPGPESSPPRSPVFTSTFGGRSERLASPARSTTALGPISRSRVPPAASAASSKALARWQEEKQAEQLFANLPPLSISGVNDDVIRELYALWDQTYASYLRRVAMVSSGAALGPAGITNEVGRLQELYPAVASVLALARHWERAVVAGHVGTAAGLRSDLESAVDAWEAQHDGNVLLVRGFDVRDWMALVDGGD
ncbi:uncharacterized protein AMSG_01310 [Thecamonas trahens ATCC 50062]|uniref:Uncharacterized protein n=1 Tax=Thecamonas trahens ATCC 50062 TaxID=461836 RepID=A0A0L0DMX0_THETB|nr:hypothetical protein AMSG_01310 [Thecamonas trahens ATCC 50062]KNC53600.1 hypothetical protein AMSG_01310 [Thecamonas trahens ATCC 50062]|eukprot:XP_013761917.1 hypothetical protein AMSG_01310 [Thecamonas trahens ATCC 50062]